MANDKTKEVLYGLYDDETELLTAVHKAREEHMDIMDVFTPFPVHGLDEAMGLAESRLHIAGFVYGAIGTLTAFLFMTWVFTRDWPIIFGGKPYWSVPAFIPITFEFTVLLASVGMVVTFYVICGLAPLAKNPVTLDDRITDDKFCLAFNAKGASESQIEQLKSFLSGTGASEVNLKTI
ncbi:MAG: DUF3341 domain-containing protein [Lewinellaceae bacterium]|nr:DUF3341 domain-containing protein [Lewinella sp.]MCB9278851.1 DUF3341 domain-containing protein [Lewinellaceae bacterium]HMQ89221.1 DUF3341 domain-containing protein [Flavilitoribacter sp.]